MLSAQQVIDRLGLIAHPLEGGHFRETFRAELTFPVNSLPSLFAGPRSASTAIYYLLTPDGFSAIHRVASDELFHFYAGDPVEMLQLREDGSGRILRFGSDLGAGLEPQLAVPGGVWQGCRLVPGGSWALLGCTVAPGFDYADHTTGERATLTKQFPQYAELIAALTRP